MTPGHDPACLDEEGVLDECVCGLAPSDYGPADYGDPLFDRDRPHDWETDRDHHDKPTRPS